MMKTAILAMALLIGGIAFGQEKVGKTPEERAYHLTTKLAKKLELSAEQTTKISDINLGIAMKNQGIRDDKNFTQEQKKEIIQSNYEAAKSLYQSVLTPDQYAKFLAWEKERIAKKTEKKEAKETEAPTELDNL